MSHAPADDGRRDKSLLAIKVAHQTPRPSPEVVASVLQRIARKQASYQPRPAVPVYGKDRNKPCLCGSGKKFKNCHLKIQEAELHRVIQENRELTEARIAKAQVRNAYEQCLRGMHTLIGMGLAESPEAESLRQQSEEIWAKLSPEEQAHFRKLSDELGKISMAKEGA